MGFNPRARTGRDVGPEHGDLARGVSIHAPARGATGSRPREVTAQQVFQSTRPHGARRRNTCAPRMTPCFNPRARTGRDDWANGEPAYVGEFQSTRPHGARLVHGPQGQVLVAFQSTRPHGARRVNFEISSKEMEFQSTRPHGARPLRLSMPSHLLTFQSTRPHGARPAVSVSAAVPTGFQSTRPHGARPEPSGQWCA